MIRAYYDALTKLPAIITRINKELEAKASSASVDILRATVGKKADQDHVTRLVEVASDRLTATADDLNRLAQFGLDLRTDVLADLQVINERLSDRPTTADLIVLKSDLGSRLELLEAAGRPINATLGGEAPARFLNAVKTGEPNLSERLATMPQTVVEPGGMMSATGLSTVEGKVTKARKPKAPKGGDQ